MTDTNPRPWPRTAAAVSLALALAAPAVADSDSDSDSDPVSTGGPPSATVQVDCAAGDSIQAALGTPARELTVEIRGICDEFVEVRRPNVTLRGATDPPLDALTSPLPDGIHYTGSLPITNALFVRDTVLVRIESLSLTSGAAGLSVNDAIAVRVDNCRLENTGFAGAFVTSSYVTMVDTLVTGNRRRGLRLQNAANLSCFNCTIEDNPGGGERRGVGIEVRDGSSLLLGGTRIAGDARAIEAGGSVTVLPLFFLDGAPVTPPVASSLSSSPSTPPDVNPGFGFVVDLDEGATLNMNGFGGGTVTPQTLEGPIRVQQNSYLQLQDVTQTIAGGFTVVNHVAGGSTLEVRTGTTLVGELRVFGFSNADLTGSAAVLGDLACSRGGDAVCDDPAVNVPMAGTTSNCGLCPKP